MRRVSGERFSADARCAWHAWVRPGSRETSRLDGPCGPASIRVRCALRSREGADAGADDAGAKGPPWRGGHNACKRTECCKKESPRGRRTRLRPVAMRPRHGPPRTGGPDQCVRVVKESHERRVPVSRLLVSSEMRSRKTPKCRPLRTEADGVPKICGTARSTLRLGQRECVKFGAGRLTSADRIPVGASRERGDRSSVLRVRAPSGKP